MLWWKESEEQGLGIQKVKVSSAQWHGETRDSHPKHAAWFTESQNSRGWKGPLWVI